MLIWEGNMMKSSDLDMILVKDHLIQIITTIDLGALNFNGFLSNIFCEDLIQR